ncbi:hypothetical protein ACHAXA_005799, partial [Cyclostephanos tholiformis]
LRAEEWYNSRNGRGEGGVDGGDGDDGDGGTGKVEFDVCLLNYYEDGNMRIGWHADREEIGKRTPIASISLGSTRKFLIRSRTDGVRDRHSVEMTNGSAIFMENSCQHRYLHSVPRETEVTGGRINLTFRCRGGGRRDGGDDDVDRGVFGDDALFHDSSSDDVDSLTMRYVVRTNIGAECYCASEITEALTSLRSSISSRHRVYARPFGIAGYVAICSNVVAPSGHREMEEKDDDDDEEDEEDTSLIIEGELLRLRTAHHVLRYHDHFELGDVLLVNTTATAAATLGATAERINASEEEEEEEEEEEQVKTNVVGSINGEMMYEFYKSRLMSGDAVISSLANLGNGGTFRTTCERIGCGHGFQAPEVEREVGGAMSEYYAHVRPKMIDFDVQIRVDVVSTKVIVGTQINVDDLSKERHFLRFRNAVTIKTNLAYAMIRCANIKIGDLVVDPFCGSGTILLEALDFYQKRIKCVGMDVSRRSANGAQENARAEGFDDDLCQFHCCDARNFRKKLEEESVDAIVTNMPWGVMTGHKNVSDLQSMYEVFLRTAWYILKDKARIVMLVLRGLQVTRIIRKLSGRYRLLSVNCIRTTNNLPSIVVVEKVAVDQVRGAVKRQLGYLAQFVSVSPEMYQAVHYEKIDETTI